MISITKLLTDGSNYGDSLRYNDHAALSKDGVSCEKGPVVVWNCTKSCNLKCVHCYAQAGMERSDNEMTYRQGISFIDMLADFNVPVILFSGGEPLMRPDFFNLAEYASKRGIRPTISTNGTLIDKDTAMRFKDIGIGYVGISIDGTSSVNDRFRGVQGAYGAAIEGIRNCVSAGQRTGLRFTITKDNADDITAIFDLAEKENVDRICFYHLVYSGRANAESDVSHAKSREAMDLIMEKTLELYRKGAAKEILTVDNHADAIYLYLKVKAKDEKKAEHVLNLISKNGGNRSGMAFGAVDSFGDVHPDQFTQHVTFGNVKERNFKDIWTDKSDKLLQALKDRKKHLKGRCSSCRWLDMCNGNFRARAEAAGGFWHSDPACYLTDEEIK